MKRRASRRWRFAVALTIMVAPLLATAGDWPTYLHDAERSAASLDDSAISIANAPQLARLWSYQTGSVVASSPVVVSGTVYVGSEDGFEYALDAATGALKWRTYLGQTYSPSDCAIDGSPVVGVTSSATVMSNTVYVGGGDANWYALDATTGAILWSVYTGDNNPITGGHYNWSSPLIYNGDAYIGIASLCDAPLVQGQLLQVDLTTRQIVNTLNVVPPGQTGGAIWPSPAVDPATNTIYVVTGNGSGDFQPPGAQPLTVSMLALDATTLAVTGAWQVPVSQQTVDSDWTTTPLLFNDAAGRPLVAAINKSGYLYAFDRTNIGAGPVWQQAIAVGGSSPDEGDASLSSGAFANNTLYIAGNNTTINGAPALGSVRALDPATGAILWEHATPGILSGSIVYANGLIVDGAGNFVEVLSAATGARLYSFPTAGAIYGLSLANGQIYATAGDRRVYAFGLPAPPPTPTATPVPDANCPPTWLCQDIGAPSLPGSDLVATGTYTITAGGSGIGGYSDQFRFVAQSTSGDAQVSAQVMTQTAATAQAQAGLMVRQSSAANAPYYGVFLTPGKGLLVTARWNVGAYSTTAISIPLALPPRYVRIQRLGDAFSAAVSANGVGYVLLPGSQLSVVMPTTVLAGLAVSAHGAATSDIAVFNGVGIGPPGPPPATPLPRPDPACPAGWSCADIGNFLLPGSDSLSGGTWTVRAAGRDIAGASDQFRYIWQPVATDGVITARVISQTNTNPLAKAGVMVRGSSSPMAPYFAVVLTPRYGITVLGRQASGQFTRAVGIVIPGAYPQYLGIQRVGDTYSAMTSTDGLSWSIVAATTYALPSLSGAVLEGLAVTSRSPFLSTARFDSVQFALTTPIPTATLPATPPPSASPPPTVTPLPSTTPPPTATPTDTATPTPTATDLPTPTPIDTATPTATSVAPS